jgi:uncharacterized protein (TIGR03663 family)
MFDETREHAGPGWTWYASAAMITATAAFLRFFDLALKPLHHDEGVNGWFLTTLFRDGNYSYDPANYHGPTLYYIALAFAKAFGLETIPIRASVAVFGVLTVVLVFFLHRYIGRTGSLAAAMLVALSPGMVFISRYFIHEIFFVFTALAFVIAIVFFIDRRHPGPFAIAAAALILFVCFFPSTLNISGVVGGENVTLLWASRIGLVIVEAVLIFVVLRYLLAWRDGRPLYLLLASAMVALMFATKETAFITLGTMAIGCVCVAVWLWIRKPADSEANELETGPRLGGFMEALGTGTDRWLLLAACAAVFLYISVLFFSSFFSYPEGIVKAVEAYAIWTKTGSKDHTQNGMWAYVKWGFEAEAPLLILSAVGAVIAFIRSRHRFAMFASLWAFGLFAAYTIIPYKTPWLALSFLLPMCLAGGYAIDRLASASSMLPKAAAAALAVASVGLMAYQTYDLNFVRYDDEDTAYVYAHTQREFLDLVSDIEHYAEKSGKGHEAAIEIVSPDYWPLVWYLRDYPHAVFQGRLSDADGVEMIVAKKEEQDLEVIRRYSAGYEYLRSYRLRSGVDLVLLIRKDLAGPDARELYRIRGGE